MNISDPSKKPSAFLSGGTGKIGRHLVRFLLEKNFVVKILTRKDYNPWPKESNVKIIKGNILDQNILKSVIAENDYVFHLAAYQNSNDNNKENFFKTNVLGAEILLKTCLRNNVKRVVYVSSTVIFKNTEKVTQNEKWELENHANLDYYASTKLDGLLRARKMYNQSKGNFPIVIVFPSAVIDINSFSSSAPSTLAQRIIWEKIGGGIPGGIVNLIGKENRILNYVIMDDLIKGIFLAAKYGGNGEEYILGGENITSRDYLRALALRQNKKVFPLRIPIFPIRVLFFFRSFLKLPSIIKAIIQNNSKNCCFSLEKAKMELGYVPEIKL